VKATKVFDYCASKMDKEFTMLKNNDDPKIRKQIVRKSVMCVANHIHIAAKDQMELED